MHMLVQYLCHTAIPSHSSPFTLWNVPATNRDWKRHSVIPPSLEYFIFIIPASWVRMQCTERNTMQLHYLYWTNRHLESSSVHLLWSTSPARWWSALWQALPCYRTAWLDSSRGRHRRNKECHLRCPKPEFSLYATKEHYLSTFSCLDNYDVIVSHHRVVCIAANQSSIEEGNPRGCRTYEFKKAMNEYMQQQQTILYHTAKKYTIEHGDVRNGNKFLPIPNPGFKTPSHKNVSVVADNGAVYSHGGSRIHTTRTEAFTDLE